jgi:hypothetical protein
MLFHGSGFFLSVIVRYLTPVSCRKGLPVDLSEGVLKATCMQALGQVTMLLCFFYLLDCK